jgi:hypothetical protein
VSDGSTFASLFVDAMSAKRRSDLNGEGYTTGSEMGAFLTDSVANYTNNKQVPRQSKLNDPKYDTGDFILLASLPTLPTNQQAVIPAAPRGSSISLDGITSAANEYEGAQSAWSSKLVEMQKSYEQVTTLDRDVGVPMNLKLRAWQRFDATVAENNPYSSFDEDLRKPARSRLHALQQPVARVAS